MNSLAVAQIELAQELRWRMAEIDVELAQLRASKSRPRAARKVKDSGVPATYGPLLANGMFYSRGSDKYTGHLIELCPTCGQRIRNV